MNQNHIGSVNEHRRMCCVMKDDDEELMHHRMRFEFEV